MKISTTSKQYKTVSRFFLPVLLFTPFISWSQGNSQADEFRKLGEAYAHLLSFATQPEISASTFDIESDQSFTNTMNMYKLPLYREFEFSASEWKWYLQGTATAFTYSEDGRLDLGLPDSFDTSVESEWRAYAGTLETGLIVPIAKNVYLAPGIGIGVSRYRNETDLNSPLVEELLAPFFDGQAFNWDSNASIARGNLAILFRDYWGNLKVRGSANIIYSYVRSFNESTDFEGFDSHNGNLTLNADVAYPLPIKLQDEPFYIIGNGAFTSFIGPGKKDLGFSHYYQAGVALGYRNFALGLQSVVGPDVDGFSITFDYGF